MDEYISREALLLRLKKVVTTGDDFGLGMRMATSHAIECIKEAPAADVAEVKHGAWKLESEIHKMPDDVDEEFYIKCPFCNRTEWVGFDFEPEKMLEWARKEYPYCHCGAKMDGKDGDV